MATTKKRKVDAECRSFQEKWTNYYFFVEVKGKPVCLVCGNALAVMKKDNLEHHYSSNHAKLNELGGQMRLDKINALQRSLESQQAAFTRPRCDRDNVIQTSYVVSELIAEKLRPHVEGEFVKECMVVAADAQLAIFVRGITAEFDTREELLSLEVMHGTTRGEDLFERLVLSMKKLQLTFEKLSGLTTDGATAMVGSQKGLIAFVKKELNRLSLDPSDFLLYITHQESLCAQSLQLNNVMSTVVSCIHFVKSRGFNSHQFKELLNDLDSEYGGLVYHCEVRWLSCGNMLMRFYELRDEVKQFMEMKGKPVREHNDSKWLCDLEFMVDITKYLSELNVKLQGPNQLLSSLLSNVKSFEATVN
ncbi:GTD2A protein, partial [Atractosteus spatula]|nr:GTD2A protein [Atractosteus spatula]